MIRIINQITDNSIWFFFQKKNGCLGDVGHLVHKHVKDTKLAIARVQEVATAMAQRLKKLLAIKVIQVNSSLLDQITYIIIYLSINSKWLNHVSLII